MSLSRRQLLQASGGMIAASSIAGCSYLDDAGETSINIGNRTPEQLNIELVIYEYDAETKSSIFFERFDLAGNNADAASATEVVEDAFETQRALVELTITQAKRQFIYYPGCEEGEDETLSIRLYEGLNEITWSPPPCTR